MGSCCFTPRRTQFLWWYWLLLASIVGIPMFLACWCVARHPAVDEEAKRRLGRRAALVFWLTALISVGVAVAVGGRVYRVANPGAPVLPAEWEPPTDFTAYTTLVVGYVAALLLWTTLDGYLRRKARHQPCSLAFLLLVLLGYPIVLGMLPSMYLTSGCDSFLRLAISLVAAHFLVNVSEMPTPRRARLACVAVVAGAFLYWAAMRYGTVAHLYLYLLARGATPDATDLASQMQFNRW